jgi:hypothetical protein
LNLHFTHPHGPDVFQADVAPECTGAAALQGLLDAKFLEPPGQDGYDLSLARNSKPVGPNATLASCGVQEGDVINVHRRGSGAS